MFRSPPGAVLFLASCYGVVDHDLPNRDVTCAAFDTSAVPLSAHTIAPAGFSAAEAVDLLSQDWPIAGRWHDLSLDASLQPEIVLSIDANIAYAEAVVRPTHMGFHPYTPDRACPAGDLLRLPARISATYSYDGSPATFYWDASVELQTLEADRVWFFHINDVSVEEFGTDLVRIFEDAHEQTSDSRPNASAEDQKGAWVELFGSLAEGSHSVKGYWGGRSGAVLLFEWESDK